MGADARACDRRVIYLAAAAEGSMVEVQTPYSNTPDDQTKVKMRKMRKMKLAVLAASQSQRVEKRSRSSPLCVLRPRAAKKKKNGACRYK